MNEKVYYKKNHPDLFSDSKVKKTSKLTREFFAYFLDTLTSESREKDFEDFCRKIIEVTVCPNLLTQTGPTGGGDSKVDSETFPVSDTIADKWLFGYGDNAHKERWAFAISAKKAWKPKLVSDVIKIVETNKGIGRCYTKIFFITNQYVSDKKRSDAEDELRKLYSIDVRIFDRTWLIEQTFKNNNTFIAINTFHLNEEFKLEKNVGPNDKKRMDRLNEIENELRLGDKIKPARLVKLSKESVDLVRQLEPEKETVINVLERNMRITRKFGSYRSYATALYDYCWTVLWWYEDRETYYEKYLEIEKLYLEHQDEYTLLKQLLTLWIYLKGIHESKFIKIENIIEHTKLLSNNFEKFISDSQNPKRALLAKFDYQMMRLQDPANWDSVISTYQYIVDNIDFNNGIKLETLNNVLSMPFFKTKEGYDKLFESLIDKLGEQSKNITSSQLLVNRGDDFLNDQPYESIRYYSRALTKLYYEKSKNELIKTYSKLGAVFESVGLLWGSRTYYTKALMESFNIYFSEGEVVPILFLALRRLKYLELALGRLEYSIHFNELEQFGLNLYPYELDDEKEQESYSNYDAVLAMSLLKIDKENLTQYTNLPDYLNESGLFVAAAALKYKIGYYDQEFVKSLGSKESVDNFMESLCQQPAMAEIPSPLPLFNNTKDLILKSKVLGCSLSIRTPKETLLMEFGATILSMVENMFATSIVDKIMPLASKILIDFQIFKEEKFSINIEDIDRNIVVKISQIDGLIDSSNLDAIHEKLMEIVFHLIAKIMSNQENLKRLEKSIKEENVLFRVKNCSSTLDTIHVTDLNFYELSDKCSNKTQYEIKEIKDIPYINTNNTLDDLNEFEISQVVFGNPPEEFELAKIKHDQIQVSDIINVPLWDKSHWKGVAVISDNKFIYPPVLGILFENENGKKIFKQWINDNRVKDIRIGIITGINKNNPFWYRVIIGNKLSKGSLTKIYANVSRLHTMEATTNKNLNLLIEAMKKHSYVYLSPILISDLKNPNLIFKNEINIKIESKQVIIKDILNISENDFLLINALMPTDNPINNHENETFAEKMINEKKKYYNTNN